MTLRSAGGAVAMACVITAIAGAQPQFRTGVTLVPIEVRAIEVNGNPVSDLTADDFVVTESGVEQEIALFQAVAVDHRSDSPPRTFLIVLGRGRLNQPTKAIEALADFVRTKSRPQDRIGIAAYMRVIDPTTRHDVIAAFLDEYRNRHEAIDGALSWEEAAVRFPMPPEISANTRARIDALFSNVSTPMTSLPAGDGTAISRYGDFGYLRKALEYLRTLPGDKHAVMVSERPFGSGHVTDRPLENFWFRLATAARSSLWYIHAGGVTGEGMVRGRLLKDPGFNSIEPWEIQDYARLADQTGGASAFYVFANRPLETIDRATRFHYLIGYSPRQPAAPAAYRTIRISVRRPGVRLLYRQGYVAEPPVLTPSDYRAEITATRLEDAAYRLLHPYPSTTPPGIWWRMQLQQPAWTDTSGGQATVAVVFDPHPSWTTYARDGDGYAADLDLLLIADNVSRQPLAERRMRLNVRLTAEEYRQARRRWFRYDTTLDVPMRPAFLRAALFDFDSDRVASVQIELPRDVLQPHRPQP